MVGAMRTISAAARVANLSPDVIRTWERRYKIVEPARDASGLRLYSDADVARLGLAREATRLGHPIRRVARLSDRQLEELVARKPAATGADSAVVAQLLDAIGENELARASQILRNAALLIPARELVLEILAPTLREVGRQWENGELAIWQEHFLSNEIINVTGALPQHTSGEARIVFATPPFERHGFGIALAALLAAARGLPACNLGVTVPSNELIAAARRTHAAAVVVGMTQETLPEEDAARYARDLDIGLPAGVDVVLGGALAARVSASVSSPRVRGTATLEEFDTLCQQWR